MSSANLLQWESLCDDRLDLSAREQSEQSGEVLPEPKRLELLQPVYAERQHLLSCRQNEPGGNHETDDPKAPQGVSNARISAGMQPSSESVNHNLPSRTKCFPGLPCVAFADTIEHGIHSSMREAANLFTEIYISIIDRNAAEASNGFESALRGGSIHFQTRNLAQLEQSRTKAAAAAMDQHSLTRPDASTPMHHLVSREVIKNEAERLKRIQARRHEHEFVPFEANVIGMTAPDRHGHDHGSVFQISHTSTDLIDEAHQIPTGSKGNSRRPRMNALAHEKVGTREARSHDPHAHGTRAGLRDLVLHDFEDLRSAKPVYDDMLVNRRHLGD